MGKNILIVTGSDYTDQVYQAFNDVKALGHRLYLLSDGSFTPRKGIFEKHFTYDLRKTKEALEFMGAQTETFDAVTIKTSEWLTPLVALLAKQYHCIGNEPIVAFNCRSKYHMRQTMAAAGVPIPKFKLARNLEELVKAVHTVGLPCVAKPVGGNASYGTFMIRDESDLVDLPEKYEKSIAYLRKKAIDEDIFGFTEEEMDMMGVAEKVDMVTDYLVEEFMAGPEISVDAVVQGGKIEIMGVEDQIRMKPPFFMQIGALLPYLCDNKEKEIIKALIEKTIHAMGIRNSMTHTEIIFTPEGPKIVEIGCRIGGEDLHDTIWHVTGYNLMFEAIMVALGVQQNYSEIPTKCHTTMNFLFPEKRGIIDHIRIRENLQEDPTVMICEIVAQPGDQVALPPESFDFLGYVCVKGDTPTQAKENLEKTLDKIDIIIIPHE